MSWSRTNWHKEILAEMKRSGDSSPIVHNTLSDEEMLVEFDSGYGGHEGKAFTCWTEQRVYFPVVYDGSEWVGSVPRDPCDVATKHLGGE